MIREQSGFSLVELVVVVSLLVPLAVVGTGMALGAMRETRRMTDRLQAEAAIAEATAVLEAELAPLTVGDGILSLTPTRIRVRAVRGAGLWCRIDSAGVAVPLTTSEWAASRLPVPGRDSIRLEFPDSASPPRWQATRFGMLAAPSAVVCPAGQPGLLLPSAVVALGGVPGALVRTEEVIELVGYLSGGATWFGLLSVAAAGAVEPVAGPFDSGGIQFEGLRADGSPATMPGEIHAVRARLSAGGASGVSREQLVSLRN